MKMSRQSRFVAAFVALFSMLFMQLAVASYACPGLNMGGHANDMAAKVGASSPAMTNCEGMDRAQLQLCHVHAQGEQSKQSLDKPQSSPDVPPFVAVGLSFSLYVADVSAHRPSMQPEVLSLTRSTSPPIAIRNCCFRI
jgi:hypothetical protein